MNDDELLSYGLPTAEDSAETVDLNQLRLPEVKHWWDEPIDEGKQFVRAIVDEAKYHPVSFLYGNSAGAIVDLPYQIMDIAGEFFDTPNTIKQYLPNTTGLIRTATDPITWKKIVKSKLKGMQETPEDYAE